MAVRCECLCLFDLLGEMVSNPIRVVALIDDSPNDHLCGFMGVIDSERKYTAD